MDIVNDEVIKGIFGIQPDTLVSWIEIGLVFTSTVLATSILNKIGEDIHNGLKERLSKTKRTED